MLIKTTEELQEFTMRVLRASALSRQEIAEKLGVTKQAISHAVSLGQKTNSARNGMRQKILKLFGYSFEVVYKVKKIQKK